MYGFLFFVMTFYENVCCFEMKCIASFAFFPKLKNFL
jgi:hypothetical protein